MSIIYTFLNNLLDQKTILLLKFTCSMQHASSFFFYWFVVLPIASKDNPPIIIKPIYLLETVKLYN